MEKIGGRIKEFPEDFVVEEILPNGKTCSVDTNILEKISDFFPKKPKEYIHFTLVKRDYTTQRAIDQLASRLRISRKRFGYSGTKDKRALTAQRVSVWNQKIEQLKKLRMRDILLKNFEYSNKRLTLGDLSGNKFTITVKNPIKPLDINELRKLLKKGIPNIFGPQRFGVQRRINHLVGKQLLLGNFEEAVKILITAPGKENPEAADARKFAAENWGNWSSILKIWPRYLGIEAAPLNYLVQYPKDFANAFRELQKKLRWMFIHAFQSEIFNLTVEKLGEQLPDELPIVGYNTKLDGEVGKITNGILEHENITLEHFKLPRMPELSEPGQMRKTTIKVEYFKTLKNTKDLIKLVFILPKGCYATTVLEAILGEYVE